MLELRGEGEYKFQWEGTLLLRSKAKQSKATMTQSQEVAIVVVPYPAQGHLNQLLHFSLNLLSSLAGGGAGRDFSVHYVSSPSHCRQARHRIHGRGAESLEKIHFHDLPIPSFPAPPPDANSAVKFPSHLIPSFDASIHLQPPLADLLRSLSAASRRLVVVHDALMSCAGHAAASVDNAESYSFYCTPAFYGLSLLWDEAEKPEAPALTRAALDVVSTRLDGCAPDEFWEHVERGTFDAPKQAGLLVNSCRAVEGEFLDLVALGYVRAGERLFAVGPVNPVGSHEPAAGGRKYRHECLHWLDAQPPASVVFVSFGSTTTISDGQIEQLAVGLRRSGQRFIWVVRDADRGDVFLGGEERRLPEGFEEEVGGRGVVVRGWAPQLEILSHPSTGAFVSHCGWNSCMESMSLGVPIVGWPMHSDQPRNAVMVSNYLKVGVTVRDWADRDRVVSAAEVVETIEKVMVREEGKEMRKRARALGEAIRLAVSDGGSSRTDMDSFIAHITR